MCASSLTRFTHHTHVQAPVRSPKALSKKDTQQNPPIFGKWASNPLESIGIHWKPLESIGIHWNPLESIGISVFFPFFPNSVSLGSSAIVKVPEQVGAAKSAGNRVPGKVPGRSFLLRENPSGQPDQHGARLGTGFPARGSQARFLSKVPRNQFPSKVPRQGSQARFPGKVPKQGSQARFPGKVPK